MQKYWKNYYSIIDVETNEVSFDYVTHIDSATPSVFNIKTSFNESNNPVNYEIQSKHTLLQYKLTDFTVKDQEAIALISLRKYLNKLN